MVRYAVVFTALAIVIGGRGADARQKGPPVRTSPPVSKPSGPRANEQDVRRLIELVGVIEKEMASVEVVLEAFKRQTPDIPEKVWTEVRAEFTKSVNREMIIGMYVPIYSKHFNAAEIRQLITFYSSPIGKKLVAETPTMEEEAFLLGVERGEELGARLRELLKARGYKVPST